MTLNLFLDSTALYTDPFFKGSFSKLLLDLSKEGKVKLHVSTIVKDETLNNYQKQIKEIYIKVKKEHDLLKHLSHVNDVIKTVSEKDLINNYQKYFEETLLNDHFISVEYEKDILPELIARSISRTKPFSENKQEFRDAIIWLSYTTYIKRHDLKNTHFISNNKRDFWDNNSTDLHPDLKNEISDLKIHSNFQEFCTKERAFLHIISERKFADWLNKQSYNVTSLEPLIKRSLWRDIDICIKHTDRLNPEKYFPGLNIGYFEYSYKRDALSVQTFAISPVSNFAAVNAKIEVDALAILYPLHRQWETIRKPVKFELDISFSLNSDEDVSDFFCDYIEINYA